MKSSQNGLSNDFAMHLDSIRRETDEEVEPYCDEATEQYDERKTLEEHREELIRSLFWTDLDGEQLYTEELAGEVWRDKVKSGRNADTAEYIWRPESVEGVAGTRTTRMYYEGEPTAVIIIQLEGIDLSLPGFMVMINSRLEMNGKIEDVVAYVEDELEPLYKEDIRSVEIT